jgi:hypothetical protein
MRVSNEHVRPLESTGRRTPTPTGFTEIVSDDFAVLHAGDPYLEQIADAGRIKLTTGVTGCVAWEKQHQSGRRDK